MVNCAPGREEFGVFRRLLMARNASLSCDLRSYHRTRSPLFTAFSAHSPMGCCAPSSLADTFFWPPILCFFHHDISCTSGGRV